ncbi:MAG: transposase [Epsilonproteobacteria bacterium]|nr:MAG: transposase [Campylobacterota bacterium]
MIEMAEIFCRHREEYLCQYGDRILPSHRKTIDDIIACRTPALGGSVYTCSCGKTERYSYHSCGNRHCPKCGNDNATLWVAKQSVRIPAVPCFLIGFTLPHELNRIIRSNQKECFNLLFRASSESIRKLAADPRLLGAQPGMLGVLHTWGRNISYHPHIHYVVPGGGIDKNDKWIFTPYKQKFFLPVRALSIIFRAKFRDGMKALGLYDAVPAEVWRKDWVVNCRRVGKGPEVIKYLSRYIYRVAITNSRILSLIDGEITFLYRPVDSDDWKKMKLPVLAFMARFLQHVLPRGFCKVRYYGFLHQRCGEKLKSIRKQLKLPVVTVTIPEPPRHFCPHCGDELILVRILQSQRGPP